MSVREKLYENLIVLGCLLLMSVIMVTVIGYFDEGHYKIYDSFGQYLFLKGNPPLIDYLVWYAISAVLGLIVFNLLSLKDQQSNTLAFRIITTMMTVPALFFVVIFILSRAVS